MTEQQTIESQGASPTKPAAAKSRIGMVVSDKQDKTVVVAVERQMKHPTYMKYIRRRKKFYAHDERNVCRIGDRVRIVETRPLSKLKRWRVESVLERAK
ncbi:30S ribosomal protein S17 [Candidatus Sumerlaeota bacterium]|nr:30S ribosomal protein S17 [Candidatus Sumerlaeota bacterium]